MSPQHFVWDTTGPLHACRADRSDLLHEAAGTTRTHVVTDVVAGEIIGKGEVVPTWLTPAQMTSLEELIAFAEWQQRLGSDASAGHDMGEAATLAWAEVHEAIAVVDDRDARKVARKHRGKVAGWCVHGVLWAIAREAVDGRKVPNASSGLVDQMLGTGITWPVAPGGYVAWFAEVEPELCSSCCLP